MRADRNRARHANGAAQRARLIAQLWAGVPAGLVAVCATLVATVGVVAVRMTLAGARVPARQALAAGQVAAPIWHVQEVFWLLHSCHPVIVLLTLEWQRLAAQTTVATLGHHSCPQLALARKHGEVANDKQPVAGAGEGDAHTVPLSQKADAVILVGAHAADAMRRRREDAEYDKTCTQTGELRVRAPAPP